MIAEELQLFFQFSGLGFGFGLGTWLLSFALRSAWVAFKTSIK
ncbi:MULTISPECIES: hypothetical protein [Eubacterium]|nr:MULTISPECIES: hypothetical protein [Eubacterium]